MHVEYNDTIVTPPLTFINLSRSLPFSPCLSLPFSVFLCLSLSVSLFLSLSLSLLVHLTRIQTAFGLGWNDDCWVLAG